jgi:hypothetical protein
MIILDKMKHVHQNKNHTSLLILFGSLRQNKTKISVALVLKCCRKVDKENLDLHLPHKR